MTAHSGGGTLLHWVPAMSPWLASPAVALCRPFVAHLVRGAGLVAGRSPGLGPLRSQPPSGARLVDWRHTHRPHPWAGDCPLWTPALGSREVIAPAREAACRRLSRCSSSSSHAARHCWMHWRTSSSASPMVSMACPSNLCKGGKEGASKSGSKNTGKSPTSPATLQSCGTSGGAAPRSLVHLGASCSPAAPHMVMHWAMGV